MDENEDYENNNYASTSHEGSWRRPGIEPAPLGFKSARTVEHICKFLWRRGRGCGKTQRSVHQVTGVDEFLFFVVFVEIPPP